MLLYVVVGPSARVSFFTSFLIDYMAIPPHPPLPLCHSGLSNWHFALFLMSFALELPPQLESTSPLLIGSLMKLSIPEVYEKLPNRIKETFKSEGRANFAASYSKWTDRYYCRMSSVLSPLNLCLDITNLFIPKTNIFYYFFHQI